MYTEWQLYNDKLWPFWKRRITTFLKFELSNTIYRKHMSDKFNDGWSIGLEARGLRDGHTLIHYVLSLFEWKNDAHFVCSFNCVTKKQRVIKKNQGVLNTTYEQIEN